MTQPNKLGESDTLGIASQLSDLIAVTVQKLFYSSYEVSRELEIVFMQSA